MRAETISDGIREWEFAMSYALQYFISLRAEWNKAHLFHSKLMATLWGSPASITLQMRKRKEGVSNLLKVRERLWSQNLNPRP